MKVSVIIPTYNRADLLNLTLSSLCEQKFKSDEYEVIISDDGSTDHTKETVSKFRERLNLHYLFQEDQGYRVSLARNQGIHQAQGSVLIFIDSGVVACDTLIEAHYNSHHNFHGDSKQNTATIGYVYGYDLHQDENTHLDYVDFEQPTRSIQELEKRGLHLDPRTVLYQKCHHNLQKLSAPWTLFWTSIVSVPRELMLKVGLFDEDFSAWGVEDIELGYRLYQNNVKFILSRQGCGIHIPHERDSIKNFATSWSNRKLFYKKYPHRVVELFTKCSSSIKFNIDYQFFLERQLHREKIIEKLGDQGIFKLGTFLEGKKHLIIGCQEGTLLEKCHSHAGLEYDPQEYQLACNRNPDVEIYQFVGTNTSFADSSFQASLITYNQKDFPDEFFMNILHEAHRISNSVYLIADEFLSDRFPASKRMALTDELTVFEIEKPHTQIFF